MDSNMDEEMMAERRRRTWYPWSRPKSHMHPALRAVHDDRTVGERVADNIASFGGSWPFIFLFLGLIAAWMVLNTIVLARVVHHKPFDRYPYIALNLVLSALAGLQAPVILMSQNRSAANDETLAAAHYKESQQIERLQETTKSLLDTNTQLTQKWHDLTVQIHGVIIASGGGVGSGPTT